MVGIANVLPPGKRSKSEEKFLVGNGLMAIRNVCVAVGETVTWGVGIVVGMEGKNLFGTGVGGDQSER
jgi:hypothetical protein